MKKEKPVPKILNFRKDGTPFDPKGFRVPRDACPEAYRIIEKVRREVRRK